VDGCKATAYLFAQRIGEREKKKIVIVGAECYWTISMEQSENSLPIYGAVMIAT